MGAATSTLGTSTAATRVSEIVVRSAAAGDETAFTALYNRYARSVYNMVLRSLRDQHLAEDVSQEVWLKAHRQLNRLREPSAFPAWIYRIAAKTCVDAARRRAGSRESDIRDDASAGSNDDDPARRALQRDNARLVWEALAVLPPHQHLALFLREVEHRSYREISHIIGISETAVGLCLFRGRRAFLKEYQRIEDGTAADPCQTAQRMMSRRMDGESTVVQDHALEEHLEFCAKCRDDARFMRQTSHQYARLGMLPVPFMLGGSIAGSASLAAGGPAGIAKASSVLAAHIKHLLLATTIAGAVGGAAVVSPPTSGIFLGGSVHQQSQSRPNDSAGPRSMAVQTAAAAVSYGAASFPASAEGPHPTSAVPAPHDGAAITTSVVTADVVTTAGGISTDLLKELPPIVHGLQSLPPDGVATTSTVASDAKVAGAPGIGSAVPLPR